MSLTPDRFAALRAFAAQHLADPGIAPESASADASFRSYWRVHSGGRSFVVMNAPPGKEDLGPWLDVARRLRMAGLNAPAVLATDLDAGFVLMSDLGTRLYLPELRDHTADALYGDALHALVRMQAAVATEGLPDYDHPRLLAELELMPTWFLQRHLGLVPACEGWDVIEIAFDALLRAALAQPRAFVHRDYHSRNLLLVEGANPGIIDFQDAVRGPLTYDLVSLLRDCYIAWPRERVLGWAESHRLALRSAGLTDADAATWKRWFDFMGLQRHIKVLGIFCRLWYRDGKAGYLGDLPLVLRYTLDVADEYAELRGFADWLRTAVGERDVALPAA
jgi:aminoglycoside/choline kinase family phosphotransferase